MILSIWGWNLICSLDYIVKGILQWKIFNALQIPGVNFKRISELRNFDVDHFFLKMCAKFIGKVTKIKGVTSRRRPHICKWAFLQVPSLILWFRSTLPLIMWIVKDSNKTGGN